MKSYWSLANFVSLGNLLCGTFSIFSSVNHDLHAAALFILLGVLFDFCDGKIARRLGQASNFGKGIDSLSDVITFGIAPAAAAVLFAADRPAFLAVLAIFVSAGAWRLAYYMQWSGKGRPPGMPITFNGLFFPAAFLIHLSSPFLFSLFVVSTLLMVGPIFLHGPEVS